MHSSYLNMAAGAFLGTCFVAMTLSIVSGAIYYSPEPAKEGFVIKVEKQPAGDTGAAKQGIPPIAPLLAKADPKQGAQVFKKCEACHSGEKGGPNKIGPNLWGVVDRPIASHPGFSYSSALKTFSDGGKKKWTYEDLNHWLHDPQGYVSGTAMTFPGVKQDQDRADVIAYLHTLADNPVPFPKPKPAAKSGAKPAAGGKAPAGKDKAAEGKAPANAAGKPAADSAPGKGESAEKSGAGKATGDQSAKPEVAPSAKPPAGNDANAGSKDNNQNAGQQNPSAQGANGAGQPASKAPTTDSGASQNPPPATTK